MHSWIAFVLLVLLLLGAAVTDVRTGKVFNWLTLPAMGAGLLLAVVMGFAAIGTDGAIAGLRASGLALMAGLIGLGVVAAAGGIGWGDVKLLGAFGAISASWQAVVSAAMYSFILAALLAVLVMIRHRLVKRTMARLLGAAMLAASKVKPDIPPDSPRIPYALALAIGGILAAGEVLLGWNTPWAAGWH